MNNKQWKWIPILAGLVLTALGLLAMLFPSHVVKVLPMVLGVAVLGLGIYELCTGVEKNADTNVLGMPRFLQALVNLAVGLVLVLNRSVSVAFLGVVLGLWSIISGILSVRAAWLYRTTYLRTSYFDGAFKIIIGVLMLLRPFGTMAAWTAVLGWFTLFVGISVLVSAFYISKASENTRYLP